MADNAREMIPGRAIAEVKQVYERCQRRYPTIQLSFEDFAARVDVIVGGLTAPPEADSVQHRVWLERFGRLHHEDLFLACACARNDRIAWEYFVDDYLPVLRRQAVQACRNLNESEDLAHEIVARLMEEREKLAGFNGRASLAGWLRVGVAHAAIDRFRRDRRLVALEDPAAGPPGGSVPVAALQDAGRAEGQMDARWGPVLSRALADEIRRLPPRDRLLLGLYYLQGVPLKLIGRQFHVHEATASRWLESLRRNIRKRIERELRTRHGLHRSEIQSLWHWVSENEGFSIQEALQR
jgi:RNA polymerase sigma-70 factor